jgi:hypothetical protein
MHQVRVFTPRDHDVVDVPGFRVLGVYNAATQTIASSSFRTPKCRNVEKGCYSTECFRDFMISRIRTPRLPTPGLSNTRVPECQNDDPRQSTTSFRDSGNRDASIPPILCLSNPRCLNPQIPEMAQIFSLYVIKHQPTNTRSMERRDREKRGEPRLCCSPSSNTL